MKRDYIIKALQRLQDNQKLNEAISVLGIDLTSYNDKTGLSDLLEESIATMIADAHLKLFGEHGDIVFDNVISDVQVFLEGVPMPMVCIHSTPTVDQFVNWLFEHYGVGE